MEGSTVSSITMLKLSVDISERLKVEVSLPLHRLEMEDTSFMDKVCQSIRGVRLVHMLGESMHGMWSGLMQQVQTACSGMERLPVERKVYVTLQTLAPPSTLESHIHFRSDGLPHTLLREDHTQETLIQSWIEFRQRKISDIVNNEKPSK
jgi:hypothetical protein